MCQSGVFNGQLLHEVWQWLLQSGRIDIYVLNLIWPFFNSSNTAFKHMFVTNYLQEEETFWNNTCLAKSKFCSQFGSSLIHPTTKKELCDAIKSIHVSCRNWTSCIYDDLLQVQLPQCHPLHFYWQQHCHWHSQGWSLKLLKKRHQRYLDACGTADCL